jgi:Icc-related predicted phosphoesterase
MGLFRRGRTDPEDVVDVFYASDVHGSDVLWRKFLGAAGFYQAAAAIMGGDLVGKAIVPIERRSDGSFRFDFLGEERVAADADGLEEAVKPIRFNGFYPWVATHEEIAARSGAEASHGALFDQVVRDDLERWMALAAARADGQPPRFVIAGNDDPWFVDEILDRSGSVEFCDDRIVRVAGHEMLSCSYANPTPWNSPRELPEDDLYERVKLLAEQLEEPQRAIFNLHVPPYGSGLDTATQLDDDLRPVYRGGQPVQVPVGSRAVRQLLEDYQPLLGLHGHIHESRGEARIGRTVAINSGSEYNTGRLHGVVVRLAADRVASHQFVVG